MDTNTVTRTLLSLILCLIATTLSGCPSKLPADGRQVQIERNFGGENIAGGRGGWSIKDGSLLLLRVPERMSGGKEVIPQKAVVHERTLYLLWEDGTVEEWPEPTR